MASDAGLVPLKITRRGKPFQDLPPKGLTFFTMEVDYSGRWVDLNDKLNFEIGAETIQSTQISWRKVVAESPITEGSYTIHAVKGMVTESIQVYVHGGSQVELNDNIRRLEFLFSRLDFRVRLTFDNYREYWKCQTSEWQTQRAQVYVHNLMAIMTFSVPRFPTVTTEELV